ncbi:uncharacterized protein LOC123560354 isoform X2 [Mercenaria mercenaria]|uniref:uncharacterized protein LOC123560354 isoform X2 n=1 Tax=Mercenaria mercenaria TaxID=6596 RepID=UPI00234F4560|nr:uncharacterized protein LOC123560354 isoform X2 [Mercenaria mercenaria]
MLSYFVCAVLVMTSFVHADELDADTLEEFQSTVYGNIMAHLEAEYQLLEPVVALQNQNMEDCKVQVRTVQESCKTCARSRCDWDSGDLIMEGMSAMTGRYKREGEEEEGFSWEDLSELIGNSGGDSPGSSGKSNGFKNFQNFFKDIGKTFSNGFNSIKNTFGNLGSKIGSGLGSFGKTIGSGFKTFGKTGLQNAGKVLGGLFKLRGRRDVESRAMTSLRQQIRQRYMAKRVQELNPATRECLEQCNECTPFLGDRTVLIGAVCGDQVLLNQAAMTKVMNNMEALLNANGNPLHGTTPIITKIEFDQSDFSMSDFSVGGVYVTAKTPDCLVRYPSNYRYKMQSPQTTADEIAQELMDKWNV